MISSSLRSMQTTPQRKWFESLPGGNNEHWVQVKNIFIELVISVAIILLSCSHMEARWKSLTRNKEHYLQNGESNNYIYLAKNFLPTTLCGILFSTMCLLPLIELLSMQRCLFLMSVRYAVFSLVICHLVCTNKLTHEPVQLAIAEEVGHDFRGM